MRRLFISDLDGTLLGADSRISARTAGIITRLSRRGEMISVATARTPATVEPLLADTLTTIPAIVMTGAAMWDRPSQRFIEPSLIDSATAMSVTAVCTECGLQPFTYTIAPDGIIHTFFSGTPSETCRRFISERSNLPLKRMHINDSAAPRHPVILIFALGPAERISAAAGLLRQSEICSVSSYLDIFDPSTAYLEVFATGVSKASAVKRLKEMTGAESLTVFGDNLNDLPMMAVADVAVAVGNALPQVKEAADVVIGPNTDDSVARYILESVS